MTESIYSQLKTAGVPLAAHESDLYAMVTPESRKIIQAYEFKGNVTTFRAEDDGKLWYDIPFAYEPFWNRKPLPSDWPHVADRSY